MQTKSQVQELLLSAGVSPNRKLGQHFLVDLNLMRLLLDSAQIGRGDVVLEVGAGTGSLTEALVERAGQVVTVELDGTLAAIAQSRLANAENVQIVNADILSGKGTINPAVAQAVTQAQTRLGQPGPIGPMSPTGPMPTGESVPAAPPSRPGRLLLVSNLPYDVASPVMINLVKGPVTADAMFVTVQREVAQRMTAPPGGREYGTLSIFLQATGAVETLRVLKPSVFWPPPQVDSAIVRYIRDERKSRRIQDMELFGTVVALFIGHRRKMLRACLKQAPAELGGRDLWLALFEQHSIDPTCRPEELSPDQYVDLANSCHQSIKTQ
ncbi:MAG: hypothetical protein A2Y76_03730 [Planctomycetes bacterium RBG_13_60_9]|nr:MAG: hypothetical protein A2Y76_03730 [Planctomycetes bacterium RBG_13_60_9]